MDSKLDGKVVVFICIENGVIGVVTLKDFLASLENFDHHTTPCGFSSTRLGRRCSWRLHRLAPENVKIFNVAQFHPETGLGYVNEYGENSLAAILSKCNEVISMKFNVPPWPNDIPRQCNGDESLIKKLTDFEVKNAEELRMILFPNYVD
jgi:hypothetical protein